MFFYPLDQKKSITSASKVSKGVHVSSNAYMLVYCLRNANKLESKAIGLPDSLSKLPTWIQKTVECENDNFEAWNRDVYQRKVTTSLSITILLLSYSIANLGILIDEHHWIS